jgi:hypothetical protein
MVAMAMRHHYEVEPGEIDTLSRRVLRQHLGVVAGVEQDALACDLDKHGVAPILLQCRIATEGIVEHRDLCLRGGGVPAGAR